MKNLLLILTVLISFSAYSQPIESDYKQFIKESQITDTRDGKMDIVWWIPTEFWEIALRRNQDVSEEQITSLIELLKPYTMFAIVKGEMGEFGDYSFIPYEDFEGKVKAVGANGKSLKPLSFEDLPVSVQTILSMIKPILKSALGNMGENMHFFVFEDKVKKGKRNFDPHLEETIVLNVLDSEYSWEAPFLSLMPPKTCPVDGEQLSGGWNYCPIHGNELVAPEETE